MIIPEECKGCGKCCIWPQFKDKEVHDFCPSCDTSILLYNGRCMYLDENNECKIYNGERPTTCINFERGSDECIKFLELNSGI